MTHQLTIFHADACMPMTDTIDLFCDPVEWLGVPDMTAGSLKIYNVGDTQRRIVIDAPVDK